MAISWTNQPCANLQMDRIDFDLFCTDSFSEKAFLTKKGINLQSFVVGKLNLVGMGVEYVNQQYK